MKIFIIFQLYKIKYNYNMINYIIILINLFNLVMNENIFNHFFFYYYYRIYYLHYYKNSNYY